MIARFHFIVCIMEYTNLGIYKSQKNNVVTKYNKLKTKKYTKQILKKEL